MEESISKKKKNIVIIIAVFLILLGVGLLTLNKFILKDEEKPNKTEEKTENEKTLSAYPYLMVVTAKYGSTDEYKTFIDKTFGTNAEERFRVYFQWYNVVHELTHGLIIYNANINMNTHTQEYNKEGYIEEQKVNDFAVAYWKKYGDPEKVQMLKETVDYILSNMKDPTDGKLTTQEYGKQLWESDNPDSSFEAYGWFQFNSVKEAFEKNLTLEEAYKNLGLPKGANFDDEKLTYDKVDETVCDKIISDTVNKFKKWGLNYPEIYHVYDDDPNNNYSNPITLVQYNYLKNN